ncbi:TetR/AcrR family transcriptional regulator [Pseudomonas aeruginosa]|uniref:TetR/AcrR family transcriptional regulator n=1 Tax=Pseudomonas aeruginosa TaxID=287 RepID=UPI00071B6101|nr:TetR/AcrR family transcriptional regulator [Pseudomonas aeruginosa]KSQ25058.1 transcriptional regulator [Pseudomonas aeruginosa]MCO1691399.1 TetR/AcrR family transcriptional regulator [Pseudomonas aeruginosa]MCO1778621.1 TetR/AcrR family transcriptional regulator [Pseudomonas aeruginosa]MCO1790070.1 TetR/AcrR family transcriptional regulator [Pseudomonas aeruginosa]MCO1799366.1 TetR/AcrR family transcriptional regulator [Pseudomonas aeruginosa]
MAYEISMNKQGQVLGRKGQETRQRLMAATRRLLFTHPLVDITAVAISKAAGTSSASFYMYFDDVQDVLYSLALEAGEDMANVSKLLEEPWPVERFEEEALRLIEALNGVWSRHREVLRYRNLEADRGDPRFEELRMNTYIPFIERFAKLILAVNPAVGSRKKSDAYAEATVLQAAMERLASTDPVVMERGLGSKRINAAIARIVVQTLRSGMPDEAAGTVPAPRARKPRVTRASAAKATTEG